ncbi:sensor histidine kinase [Pontibacter harenae]|uniref:sensor histidine kinase n=1 Tax=Pontibacter harenae TaxID=2894083 RepID=UPI001E4410EE|nr:histidine kinase [Pontibacter harenae]MCC9167565.1 histidine kinase [Pontibacter harenae]
MDFKKLHLHKLRFWQQWLLLAFGSWFLLNLYDILLYLYRLETWGNYIINEDGTPVTVWQRFFNHNAEQLVWLFISFIALLAEANYHYIFRRKGTKLFILTSIACGVAGAMYFFVADELRYGLGSMESTLPATIVIALLVFLYALVRDYIYKRIHVAESRSEKSQAELNALKAQVNPHFFFNTLNSLYGTALEEEAPSTAESIDQLAGIMRYTMNEAQQDFTSILNEIKFIEDYLHLQSLRLPARENIEVKTEISYDGKPCIIAPMLLIPFIENAFKYGISMDYTCWVHIQLKVKEQQLHLIVQNKILRENMPPKGQGTGIENTKKRLQLLYPNRHKLETHQTENFIVDLHLQLHS